jgi:hypothetical protein
MRFPATSEITIAQTIADYLPADLLSSDPINVAILLRKRLFSANPANNLATVRLSMVL